ncbi:hypothetical protein [Ferruginibacter sp. SUN106]|uniref:hypothetical protein n=1 Tax=Ferruginibacter sp. SUN106 TaxID=2978348 RepID=UPI003D3673DD
MKIARKFSTLTKEEYFFFIDNYKKYSDFNTLGLYRSIIENEKLQLTDKIEVRDCAHKIFKKTFEFLQLKDPKTYFEVSIIGQEVTKGDEESIWNTIKANQQKILADKKIRHRNFGDYSKHNCGREHCPYNGLMIKQGSWLAYGEMHFNSDKSKFSGKIKSDRVKKARKNKQQIIRKIIDTE